MIRIAIIIGSTRPNRNGDAVGQWVHGIAQERNDAEFELIDLLDWNLPLLDESFPPSMDKYEHKHTKDWAATIASFDGFVFVAPEYNHGINAALKNAIDFIFKEWNNKAAGFVSYGSEGGVRAVEQLRQVMGTLMIADVREQVMLTLRDDFENRNVFKPRAHHEKILGKTLDQLIEWSGAMKQLRDKERTAAHAH
jgi:NAD(P)H-dependent FMN reductase